MTTARHQINGRDDIVYVFRPLIIGDGPIEAETELLALAAAVRAVGGKG